MHSYMGNNLTIGNTKATRIAFCTNRDNNGVDSCTIHGILGVIKIHHGYISGDKPTIQGKIFSHDYIDCKNIYMVRSLYLHLKDVNIISENFDTDNYYIVYDFVASLDKSATYPNCVQLLHIGEEKPKAKYGTINDDSISSYTIESRIQEYKGFDSNERALHHWDLSHKKYYRIEDFKHGKNHSK